MGVRSKGFFDGSIPIPDDSSAPKTKRKSRDRSRVQSLEGLGLSDEGNKVTPVRQRHLSEVPYGAAAKLEKKAIHIDLGKANDLDDAVHNKDSKKLNKVLQLAADPKVNKSIEDFLKRNIKKPKVIMNFFCLAAEGDKLKRFDVVSNKGNIILALSNLIELAYDLKDKEDAYKIVKELINYAYKVSEKINGQEILKECLIKSFQRYRDRSIINEEHWLNFVSEIFDKHPSPIVLSNNSETQILISESETEPETDSEKMLESEGFSPLSSGSEDLTISRVSSRTLRIYPLYQDYIKLEDDEKFSHDNEGALGSDQTDVQDDINYAATLQSERKEKEEEDEDETSPRSADMESSRVSSSSSHRSESPTSLSSEGLGFISMSMAAVRPIDSDLASPRLKTSSSTSKLQKLQDEKDESKTKFIQYISKELSLSRKADLFIEAKGIFGKTYKRVRTTSELGDLICPANSLLIKLIKDGSHKDRNLNKAEVISCLVVAITDYLEGKYSNPSHSNNFEAAKIVDYLLERIIIEIKDNPNKKDDLDEYVFMQLVNKGNCLDSYKDWIKLLNKYFDNLCDKKTEVTVREKERRIKDILLDGRNTTRSYELFKDAQKNNNKSGDKYLKQMVRNASDAFALGVVLDYGRPYEGDSVLPSRKILSDMVNHVATFKTDKRLFGKFQDIYELAKNKSNVGTFSTDIRKKIDQLTAEIEQRPNFCSQLEVAEDSLKELLKLERKLEKYLSHLDEKGKEQINKKVKEKKESIEQGIDKTGDKKLQEKEKQAALQGYIKSLTMMHNNTMRLYDPSKKILFLEKQLFLLGALKHKYNLMKNLKKTEKDQTQKIKNLELIFHSILIYQKSEMLSFENLTTDLNVLLKKHNVIESLGSNNEKRLEIENQYFDIALRRFMLGEIDEKSFFKVVNDPNGQRNKRLEEIIESGDNSLDPPPSESEIADAALLKALRELRT